MNPTDRKRTARQAAYARRAKADPAVTGVANRNLEAAIRSAPGRAVAGYWPIRTEIDPRPTLHALAGTHDLCLPVVGGTSEPLAFRHWTPDTEMELGAYGAAIPVDPVDMIPSILIVPLAAFDRRGYRLGYGGGFYDRTLEELRYAGQITAIGFAFAIQEMDEVPREPTDQPLDLIVTENGVIAPADS